MNKLMLPLIMLLFFTTSYAQQVISSHTVGNQTKSYSKILVLVKAKSATNRIELEDDIVQRLQKKDIDAVPSYVRLPQEALKTKAKDAEALKKLVATLRKNGFDGILVTSLVYANKSVEYNPGKVSTSTVPVRYGRFGRYYGTTTVAAYEPASIDKNQNLVLESLLYDLRGSTKENSLHWIGKIKITDPTNFDKTSDKYAKTLVKKVTKEAID